MSDDPEDFDPEFLRRAVDRARLAILETDAKSRVVRANRHAARLFGYADPAAMFAGVAHARELYARESDRDWLREKLARGEDVSNVVIELRRRDGRTFWALHGVDAKLGPGGEIQGVVGWIADAGVAFDGRQAGASAPAPIAQHMAQSDFLAQLFAATDTGIYQTATDGTLLRANPALARMFGFADLDEMCRDIAGGVSTLYADPAERARKLEILQRDGALHGVLWQARRRDGGTFWVRESALRVAGPPERFLGTLTDVTALVEAWADVRRAEASYRSLFENAAHGMYRSSPEGKQLRANPALVRLNGYADEAEMLAAVNDIGTEWYVDPGRRDAFKRLVETDGRVRNFESEIYRHKTRERIWISESAWVVRGQDGRVLYYEGMVEDITERKRVERAFVAAKAEAETLAADFRSIFDNSNVGIFRTLPDGRPTRCNLALARINGFDAPEAQIEALAASGAGSPATGGYVDPGRRAEYFRAMSEHGKVENFVSEIRRRATGEQAWVSENAWEVRDADGTVVAYEGTVIDVTERVRAERALAEAKAEAERLAEDYRSIFENANFGIYRTDAQWRQTRVNPTLARLNGLTVDEQIVVGRERVASEGWYVDPGRRADFRAIMARDGRVAGFESEIARRRGGDRIWVSENAWTVRDRDGKVVAYEGMVEDITARKQAEAALREAKAEAEAASAAKSAFLAVMSHELRTPLNAIIGFAEVIEGKYFGPDDPRYFEYAGYIGRSGTHLLTLINDILDLSKIGAGQFELRESETDLAEMALDTVKLFDASAAKGGVTLALAPDFPVLRLRADALRIKQVLMNLVSNAIKFTSDGGRVTLGAALAADAIRVWVEDTGIGMTASEAKRAMEPFVQIDDGLARKHGGTGLGLPISKELVALHGGTLIVTSEKGKGTRVTVELPVERRVD
jgi:PAS domain S-box-containing protein